MCAARRSSGLRFLENLAYLVPGYHGYKQPALRQEEDARLRTRVHRKLLHLPNSMQVVSCHHRTPFWLLLRACQSYVRHDRYTDVSGGTSVNFSQEEVDAIRDLAKLAEQCETTRTALNNLVKHAQTMNLPTLDIHIEAMASSKRLGKDDKCSRVFGNKVRQVLGQLGSDGVQDERDMKNKRAQFIKLTAKIGQLKK